MAERPATAAAPANRADAPGGAGAPVVLTGIRKCFAGQIAVDGLSLGVDAGELVVLLGPSGCGKTTTLNLIAGFLAPDGGDITLDGRSIVRTPVHRRNIGVVFQRYALFPHLNVFDNVAFGLRRRKVRGSELRTMVMEKLELVGLAHLVSRLPHQLSGGQQQRVALARALAVRPRLLLLDEPLSNLDARLRVEMRGEIRRLVTREGVTAVFVTHDQEEALRIADRIAVMRDGRVLQYSAPQELYGSPQDLFVADFVGRSNKLPGTIAGSAGDGLVAVRLASGEHVTARSAAKLEPGSPALVVVRPEHMALAGAPRAGWNSVRRTLSQASFVGGSVELAFEGGDLVVDVPAATSVEVGRVYDVSFDPTHALAFAAEGRQ